MIDNNFRKLGKPITQAGERIDAHLAQNFLFFSRNQWCEKIRTEDVTVNSRRVKRSYRLKLNDEISYFRPQTEEPEVDTNIRVIWEHEGIKAVYKPSNLPMHESGAYRKNTFFEVAREKIGPECFAVHRLDRETSGILLCSEDKDLRNILSRQLRERKMQKTYYAFVFGTPSESSWVVDAPIGECRQTTFRTKKWVEPDGLPSQTSYRLLETRRGISWLEVSPRTGRTHQIRVHSAWSGHHLVGDKKYHPDESVYLESLERGFTPRVQEAILWERLCLHAAAIEFLHPVTKSLCKVECPLPQEMVDFWESLKA